LYAAQYVFEGVTQATYNWIPGEAHQITSNPNLIDANVWHSHPDYNRDKPGGNCRDFSVFRVMPEEVWITQMVFAKRQDADNWT
jgi:hypothetical protein